MPDMNTSHSFTAPEARKYEQYINGLWVNAGCSLLLGWGESPLT